MIESDLPIGKGLASSSADLLATARAIESCYGINIPISLLQRFMVEIEPTDGVMYPGVVSFFHRKVELGEIFGPMPRMTVVAVDEGGKWTPSTITGSANLTQQRRNWNTHS